MTTPRPDQQVAGRDGWSFPQVQPYGESEADPPQAYQPAEAPPYDENEATSYRVPRRMAAGTPPVSPARAVAGALVAVAGVLLGIGALLWATEAPGGSPTVATGQAQTAPSPITPSPTIAETVAPAAPPPPVPAAVAPPVVTPRAAPAAPAAPAKLPLTVLNNSRTTGLADRAAARFRAGGWPIKLTGNFRGKVTETTVYYGPGQLASAQLLQRSFGGLTRVRPRFATLPGTGLTVVLTRDYAR